MNPVWFFTANPQTVLVLEKRECFANSLDESGGFNKQLRLRLIRSHCVT
jgi:hypothetical protein